MSYLVDTNFLLRLAQSTSPLWEQLVIAHQVMGKQVHDTRLVAAMLVHQITHLLTFNTDDFKRFTEITTIAPRQISG